MSNRLAVLFALALLLAAGCGGDGEPQPTATAGRTPARTATGTQIATTPTATPTAPAATPPAPTATSPGETPAPTTTYTVQPGDTLYSIALRFGTTVEALAAANGLADPSLIYVGQVLRIVGGNGPPPPTPPPPPPGEARVVRRGDPARRVVALTFDAGSDTGFTTQILETLAANGIKASFGITGRWAEQNPELLRRIVREGHPLINHSYDHPSFTGYSTGEPALTRSERWSQLDRAEEAFVRIAGRGGKPYFRSPYGDYDASVNADLAARDYTYNVLWTVDSLGWNGLSPQGILDRCLSNAQPGAVFLFHVGSASQDAAALQRIIDGLRGQGYGFVTVPQMFPP